MSLLVIAEILGLFANILTADDEHSLHKTENLRQPILVQLSKNSRIFSQYFGANLKFR